VNPGEYEAMYRLEDGLWWYTGMRRISEAVLDSRLQFGPPGQRILDAGCGTGGNLRWLGRFGAACGVDLSPHAVRFCARRGLGTVARATVLRLPFPEATFDLVTSFDVVYHLDVADDVAALAELRRVLRPGGWALIRVPALEQVRSAHDAAVHTRHRYSLAELRDKVGRAGLTVARASYANALLLPVAAAARLLARWVAPPAPGRAAAPRSDVRPLPPAANALLRGVLGVEAALIARHDLPLGLSALVLAQRPLEGSAA
jgi:SAM-dependent methyltransferase